MNLRMKTPDTCKLLIAALLSEQSEETSLPGSFGIRRSMACLHIKSPTLSKESTASSNYKHQKQSGLRQVQQPLALKPNPFSLH